MIKTLQSGMFPAAVISLLLAACAHAPQSQQPIEQTGRPVATGAGAPALPNHELTEQMLYELLVADVAAQRGIPGMGAKIYLDMATAKRDPRLARRAALLFYDARRQDDALEAAQLWRELEPDSPQARQMQISLLLESGRLVEVRPYLMAALAAEKDQAATTLMHVYLMLSRLSDRDGALGLMVDLARDYPDVAEAHWMVAQLAEAAGKQELALAEARKAQALRPDWDKAVMLVAQLLQRTQLQQALDLLDKYLAGNPDAREVRLMYARLLMDNKRYREARVQFQALTEAFPDRPELSFTLALLSLELGDLERAESEFRKSLDDGKKDRDAVYYYLGQVYETGKRNDEALQHYRKVTQGEYVFQAGLRAAYLLGKTGRLDEGRQILHQLKANDDTRRAQLVMAEAQILREAGQRDEAWRVLNQGLENMPEQPELLYDAAMLADQSGKHDTFEALMRRLILIKPEYAHGYNALGYSFLDRNERLQEGMTLVEKAHQLAPDDAAIMDSVGWGHYRLGNLTKSMEFLRRAYAARPDPEIAAHLGEVLWVAGEREEASKIWRQALKDNPDSSVLSEVMKKFLP